MHEICSFLRDDLDSKDATQIPKYYIRGEMKKQILLLPNSMFQHRFVGYVCRCTDKNQKFYANENPRGRFQYFTSDEKIELRHLLEPWLSIEEDDSQLKT